MQNVVSKIEGNTLTIMVDLTQEQGRTKGDKGTVIAASKGYRSVADNPLYNFTFQLYRKDASARAV